MFLEVSGTATSSFSVRCPDMLIERLLERRILDETKECIDRCERY